MALHELKASESNPTPFPMSLEDKLILQIEKELETLEGLVDSPTEYELNGKPVEFKGIPEDFRVWYDGQIAFEVCFGLVTIRNLETTQSIML